MGAKTRALAALLFVFVAGVSAGIVFERHRSLTDAGPKSTAEEHEAAMAELTDLLELDDDQLARIHEILNERQAIVQAMWEQLRPEVQSEMRNVHVEIAEVLRPDQRERFHEWLMDRRAEQETTFFHER